MRHRDRPHPKRAKRAILLLSFDPRRPRTKGPDGFPSECIPQHEALSKRAKRAIIPPAVIRRRPDIVGAAVCFLSGAFRRTQEALAARSAQRGLLACPRTRRGGACSLPGQERLITRRCKPSCACPRQHRTGYQSGSREASSSRDRSRCSQPGRSRSRRRRKPCCRSRQPGR